MTAPEMHPVRGEGELEWLRERVQDDGLAGFDAAGWLASTWILHAMYINRSLPPDLTHDDLDKATRGRRDAGRRRWFSRRQPPDAIDKVVEKILAESTDTGIPLGFTAEPGPPWERLTWEAFADELGVSLGEVDVPPCFKWFPLTSWPARIMPAPEGSMDEMSQRVLLTHLSQHSDAAMDTEVFAYYSPLTSADFDNQTLFVGPLGAVPSLTHTGPRQFTPSNIWPRDRSWLVYTDYDLEGTKVSGKADLIAALIADPDLETTLWPTGPGS